MTVSELGLGEQRIHLTDGGRMGIAGRGNCKNKDSKWENHGGKSRNKALVKRDEFKTELGQQVGRNPRGPCMPYSSV